MTTYVDFCGETYPVDAEHPLVIGREGRLAIDDNPYLHRKFLEVSEHGGMVWLANLGSQLSATVSDSDGLLQAWLAPGARLPLVFGRTSVWFTAGPTTYELDIVIEHAPFVPTHYDGRDDGEETIGGVSFTLEQRLLVVALAEQVLRRGNRGAGSIPSSPVAAERLGWTLTKFNRKLDGVCQKLAKHGVRGLHGDAERLASSRRARLVEYAVASRLVTADDLPLLDALAVSPPSRASG